MKKSFITNKVKQLRIKLKLLDEQEGLNWLLLDIIDETIMSYTESEEVLSTKWRMEIINGLKEKYKKRLQELVPPDPKQGVLL